MKKIGILLGILLIAGVCAMADEAVAVQDDFLFADIDAVALSQEEMSDVDGEGPVLDIVVKVATAVVGLIISNETYTYVRDRVDTYVKEKTSRSISENIDRFIERNFTIRGRVNRMMGN